jgi:hypothetical protein
MINQFLLDQIIYLYLLFSFFCKSKWVLNFVIEVVNHMLRLKLNSFYTLSILKYKQKLSIKINVFGSNFKSNTSNLFDSHLFIFWDGRSMFDECLFRVSNFCITSLRWLLILRYFCCYKFAIFALTNTS